MVTPVAQLELDIDIPVDLSNWSGAEVQDYGRRLAVALFVNTLADARAGDLIARLWLTGWCADFLEAMGLDGLAQLADSDLDALIERIDPRFIEIYLAGVMQRCWDCVHCVRTQGDGDRYRCARRHWKNFAESTARQSSRMKEYQPCADFEKKEQDNG